MPPWIDTSTYTFELAGQKTDNTAPDHEVVMQTLEKDWDSYDPTINTDGAAQMAVAAPLPPLAPQVSIESTVSALSRPAIGAHPYKSKSKLREQFSNWYRRMSPSTGCTSFQIVCQHSNACKIFIHSRKLPIPMKTRFWMLWLR